MINRTIVRAICEHADKEGSSYSYWYVGTATNARQRLFEDHNVSEENAWWIIKDAASEQNARDTERYLLGLGFDGGPGGGSDPHHIYAYRKARATIERQAA